MGFDCNDGVHLALTFGQVQVSRPQVVSSVASTPPTWPPPPEVIRTFGDTIKKTRSIPTSIPNLAIVLEVNQDGILLLFLVNK